MFQRVLAIGATSLTLFCICGFTAAPQVSPKADVDAVFLGDSITAWWKQEGIEVWNANYANFSLNTGVSGLTSLGTIDQIVNEGVLDGLNPKIVVLLTGANDLAQLVDGATVGDRIATIVSLVQERTTANILLLALLPAGGVPDFILQEGQIVNGRIAALDNARTVRSLDMMNQFGSSPGTPYRELYVDELFQMVHLSAAGYAKWHETMGPLFQQLINSRVG